MNNWIILAIFAGISMWAWSFFHDKSTSFINPIVWATLVSLVAVIIWIIIIIFSKDISLETIKVSINYKAIGYIILVWLFAFLVDYFTLKTFATWINISVWFPIIIIVSIVSSIIFWIFFTGEQLNINQFFWIILAIYWIYLILGK